MRDAAVFVAVLALVLAAADSAAGETDDVVKGVALNGDALTEDSCEVLATTQGKDPELRAVPGMHVLDRTAQDPLVLVSTADVKINAVVCWRSEARLGPNDYLVPHKTGFSLYIKTDTGEESRDRTIALEKVGGSFRVRLVSGPEWGPTEKREIQQLLDLYHKKTADGGEAPAVNIPQPKNVRADSLGGRSMLVAVAVQ